MLNLSSALIAEKNKLSSNSAWIVLLEITVPSYPTVIRLAKNNVDVVFAGQTYTAFPMEIDTSNWTSKGDIPTLGVRVSNIANTFNQILKEYDGGIGGSVTLTLVSSEYLAENYAELQRVFTILAASVDNYWVSWSLGNSNPLRQRLPLYTYMAHYCNWVQNFKGAECKYAGGAIVKKIENPVVKFNDDFASLSGSWQNYNGGGSASIISEFGSNFLRLGANDFTSDGQVWFIHNVNIPFNPAKMYKISCRFKRSMGNGVCFIGLAGVAANGTSFVNTDGVNVIHTQYYPVAWNYYADSQWTEFVGYMHGTANPGVYDHTHNFGTAGKFHTNVAYIRPLILANYPSKNGRYEIDYFKVEELDITDSSSDTCNGTWLQCQAYNNTANFGGHPGLYNPEVKIV